MRLASSNLGRRLVPDEARIVHTLPGTARRLAAVRFVPTIHSF
jgi:hypothetical protein